MPKPKTRTPKQPELVTTPAPVPPVLQVVEALSVKQWTETPALQQELLRVLNLPIMKMAFSTILHAAMPSAKPVGELVPGVSAEAMALQDSNRYHHRSGMTHTYRALHGLAKAKEQPKAPAQWGDLLPESE